MAWLVGHRETKDAANRDATPIVTAPVVDSTERELPDPNQPLNALQSRRPLAGRSQW